MARYRVQGPDGAIHVFDGPDEATPEQVEAFASQTFGGQRAAPKNESPKPEDPGFLKTVGIAAGKATDSVLDGLTQMYLGARGEDAAGAALKQTVEEKERLYKPLQEMRPVATGIGEAAPSMAVPVGGAATLAGNVGRLALAGGAPEALKYGTAGERATRAAGGAAAGVAGGVIAPKVLGAVTSAVPAIGRTTKAFVEPLTSRGREAIAGRTLNTAAGDTSADVAARLSRATQMVPGSMPTAAQVAENGGIAALERSVAAKVPDQFTARAMEQSAARTAALRSIAQDEPAKAAAIAARKTATDPLYEQAKGAAYTVDPRLDSLLQRPAMQQALKRAETLAANEGRSFSFDVAANNALRGAGVPGQASRQVTGQGLQDLKMAMDEMLTDPTSGFSGKAGDAVKGLRGQLLNWMEGANPAFKAARTTFADMSKPINQMDIGSDLLDKLAPALADHGALGKETAAKFAQALRNAPLLAKNATKFPGAKLEEIMTPEQMGLINSVARDLARKSNAQDLGRGAGSDTFQKLAMDNIAQRSGAPRLVGGALSVPGVSKIGRFLYEQPEEQIQSLLAQSLLDPQMAARLMSANPRMPTPQTAIQMLFANPGRTAQIAGGAAGMTAANMGGQ